MQDIHNSFGELDTTFEERHKDWMCHYCNRIKLWLPDIAKEIAEYILNYPIKGK